MKTFKHFRFPESINKSISDLKKNKAIYWESLGVHKLISLTNFAISDVPAYKKFLSDNDCFRNKISSLKELKKLSLVNKDNYLRKYKYSDLFPKGYINDVTTLSSTSGSTGEPFYFPRGEEQDQQYEYIAEMFLKNQFEIDKYRTLAINGFGLGIWIGGIFTYKNFNKISSKGYRLAVAPTGRDKKIFIKTFKKMAPFYEQIILMGYPPFIKDVLDEGIDSGINWGNYQIKIMTATESFSEEFRDYLIKKSKIKNIYTDLLNIYGSVEFGTMSHETPLSILIRRIATKDKKVFESIFPGARTVPTLVQYYPNIVYFEELNGEVVASGYGSSFPLIRYQFFDKGGVYKYNELIDKLNDLGVDIIKEAKKKKIDSTIYKLPFVYVHERSDFVVNLRGANIYPGNVRNAFQKDEFEEIVTGKFTMIKKEDKYLNEYLEINVELRKNENKSKKLSDRLKRVIVETLINENSEYASVYSSEPALSTPKIVLCNNEDPKYFSNKLIKQKWVIK